MWYKKFFFDVRLTKAKNSFKTLYIFYVTAALLHSVVEHCWLVGHQNQSLSCGLNQGCKRDVAVRD